MRSIFVGAVMFVAACSHPSTAPTSFDDPTLKWARLGKSCPENSAAVPLSAELKASLPSSSGSSDVVDAGIAREIPGGWGGRGFLEHGKLNMFFVDPSKKDVALAALAAHGITVPEDVQARQGRWDFGQLYDWYLYLIIHALPGVKVSSTDIQEARNRLEFAVIDEGQRVMLEQNLSKVDIPCYLVAIYVRGYATTF